MSSGGDETSTSSPDEAAGVGVVNHPVSSDKSFPHVQQQQLEKDLEEEEPALKEEEVVVVVEDIKNDIQGDDETENHQDQEDLENDTHNAATAENYGGGEGNHTLHLNAGLEAIGSPGSKQQTYEYDMEDEDDNDIESVSSSSSTSKLPCALHPSTPIPNSDTCLRLLRKFLARTSNQVPSAYGGNKPTSILSFLFGNSSAVNTDQVCLAYKHLVDILVSDAEQSFEYDDDDEDDNHDNDNDNHEEDEITKKEKNEEKVVIESILGGKGDTMSKARSAMASFCYLLELLALETQRLRIIQLGSAGLSGTGANWEEYEQLVQESKLISQLGSKIMGVVTVSGQMIAAALTCAEGLVAHGCLDGVKLGIVMDEEEQDVDGYGEKEQEEEVPGRSMESSTDYDDFLNGDEDQYTYIEATHVLCESVYKTFFDSDIVELAALKFLLTMGCRSISAKTGEQQSSSPPTPSKTNQRGDKAMMSGSYLLQAIRICYKLYLSTDSESNKTTAKAALRQIVTSTFKRLESANASTGGNVEVTGVVRRVHTRRTSVTSIESNNMNLAVDADPFLPDKSRREDMSTATIANSKSFPEGFASYEHKDAYLVLRSLCKLSMKAVHIPASYRDSSSGYGKAAMARTESSLSLDHDPLLASVSSPLPANPTPRTTEVLDPALDSKILALDLILEILSRTQTETLLNAGPQLIYAVRNYLCHSLLKNCTLDHSTVVDLSLRLFVPLIQHFRQHLKTEIEAFVTNVFFVILDSKNSPVEHKLRVVVLFDEICSDPATLAEIFLNYDCDLSAVDLFQRIVNSLARVAKIGLHDQGMMEMGSSLFVGGATATRAERIRHDHRALRLEAMRAVRQILSSLYASIAVTPWDDDKDGNTKTGGMKDENGLNSNGSLSLALEDQEKYASGKLTKRGSWNKLPMSPQATAEQGATKKTTDDSQSKSLVQIYDSKRKRREEFEKAVLKYNQKPSAGIAYATEVGILNGDDPSDVAQFLLVHKDVLDKTQTGEYLGREPTYQEGFALKVLHNYANQMDFAGLRFDEGIKFYLSGFRLPGEAQKIDRIMEKFAEKYTTQNPEVFPNADSAFILAFSVIMLNTDLHNPAIKEERRMTLDGFVRNNSGICDGQDLPRELLEEIFYRIKTDPISLKEDDEAREKAGESKKGPETRAGASGLFSTNFDELDKQRETDFQKERDEILRNTESLLRRKKKSKGSSAGNGSGSGNGGAAAGSGGHSSGTTMLKTGTFVRTQDSGLKDEYVIPMFDVTWAPALAVFSTVIESANGTMGSLLSIATDAEIESAAENAATATEVCLSGFRLAIRIAALCGNDTARSAYVHALSNFSLLGTGRLLEHRHIRCVQTMLELGRDDGELLGNSWEYVFKALSEVARLNTVYEVSARYARAEAAAATRRRKRLEAEQRLAERRANEEANAGGDGSVTRTGEDAEVIHLDVDEEDHDGDEEMSYDSFDSAFSDDLIDNYLDDPSYFDEELDKKMVDEMNARAIHETIPADLSDEIFSRSSTTLSTASIQKFVFQLCRVSRMEIAGYGGQVGSKSNDVDLTAVHYRKQHSLLSSNERYDTGYGGGAGSMNYSHQPDIYCLQKLVEVTHYNMDTRPRLVFSELWNHISGHLTSTALHSNAAVAMYAVDSFRQLSMQFLKRQELGVFEFQRKFIKPFEGVMLKCKNASVKEYLLKAVEQIIIMYGNEEHSPKRDDDGNVAVTEQQQQGGLLKSGWRPLLAVIGQASCDEDDAIAKLGFAMLTEQLRKSLKVKRAGVDDSSANSPEGTTSHTFAAKTPMRADKFVDLVEALLMYVSGPREDMSTISIDHLVTLCRYLADDGIPLPQSSKPSAAAAHQQSGSAGTTTNGPDAAVSPSNNHVNSKNTSSNELELWWPILLGLSKSVGDPRPNIRIKGLVTLLAIINQHFFVVPGIQKKSNSVLGDLQTLQLIFRGILTPTLEHAETRTSGDGKLPLPDGFIRFMTRGTAAADMHQGAGGGRKDRIEASSMSSSGNTWLDTTFDHLMDGAIAATLKSIEVYKDEILIEEVLAMFNTCLVSDSASMAIRGLKRLYHFVANDLVLEGIKENTWATVSHMLRRCLAVSGLPFHPDASSGGEFKLNREIIGDFLQEEELLPQRRYIGSNATSVIGSLLTDEQIVESMGPDWYLFLYSGLGMGTRTWDTAAEIVDMHPLQSRGVGMGVSPPQYAENALYTRKWMVKLLLKLVTGEDMVFGAKSTTDKKSKTLLREEFRSLVNTFLKKEAIASTGNASPGQVLEIEHMTKMVCTLLEGMAKLDAAHLSSIASLTPMLSACIQVNDRTVRTAVHGLLTRIFELSEGNFAEKD